ncbi:hypothetical protein [Promicromonospora soli]
MSEEPHETENSHDADVVQPSFAEIARRVPSKAFAPPIAGVPELPLRDLEPIVLERLVAQLVYRHDHRGVQFYGRSGQKQYGLDVVEARPDGGYTLYQVKRYQEITPDQLRDAVEAYAGEPRPAGHGLAPRRFGADRFVVVTSAQLDADTANVDALAALRAEYTGDLDIDAWGSEALSRQLRDLGRVVHAVFGEAWAKEFCAFEMSPAEAAHPEPLGLIEQPATVLGLDTMLAEATTAEPEHAAVLYQTVAAGLDQNGFPGHASVIRRREAESALLAGDGNRALEALWPGAIRSVERGEHLPGRETLKKIAKAGGYAEARVGLLLHASEWSESGTDLEQALPWLDRLAEVKDPELPLLACLTLERALADGLFEFDPPRSVVAEADSSTPDLLSRLINASRVAVAVTVTPVMRARLGCALADAALRASSPTADVDAQFRPLLTAAASGRYHKAAGLVAARAARASALHGDPSTAEELWRRAVLVASEAGFYGDARGSLRSMMLLDAENGTIMWRDLPQVVEAMPNRDRLIDRGGDAMLYALAQAHAGKLPDAFGHARHGLLVARTNGDLDAELTAVDLFGDVLDSGEHPAEAVECWVSAGKGKKAAKGAGRMNAFVDVRPWLALPWRRRSDAAAQVLGRQADLVPDADTPAVVDALLDACQGLWGSPWMTPHPELRALNALGDFAGSLSRAAVDRLLTVCEPAVAGPTNAGPDVARVLFLVYWSQPEHRALLAPAIIQMLGQDKPPHNAWSLARRITGTHEPLLATVQTLVEAGRVPALLTLSKWGHADKHVQQAARRACSALLHRPVAGSPNQGSITGQDSETVQLLLALLGAPAPIDFAPETFRKSMAWNPGVVLMSLVTVVEEPSAPGGEAPSGKLEVQESGGHETDVTADGIAQLCAGPPAALAEAVAEHLLKTAEDRTGLASVRVQPVNALSALIGHLEQATAVGMVTRLLDIHHDPGLTAHDKADIANNVPLSRFRIGGHGADLAPAALLAASRAVNRAADDSTVGDALRAHASDVVGAAIPLLQSARYASWAAEAVRSIASADVGQENAALLLATHEKVAVRQIGALALPGGNGLLRVLATDDSAAVRRAVASRATELDDATLDALRADPNRSVRTALTAALAHQSERTTPESH